MASIGFLGYKDRYGSWRNVFGEVCGSKTLVQERAPKFRGRRAAFIKHVDNYMAKLRDRMVKTSIKSGVIVVLDLLLLHSF